MKSLKRNPILSLINSYVIDSPSPLNLSYLWNYGSLLGLCLVIQIVSGVVLAMHYCPNVDLAFSSVEHIMRDVNNGWLIRYVHANGASLFFVMVYIHIARGLYYGSYRKPRILLWSIGVVIFLLMIITAFLGYVNIAQNNLISLKLLWDFYVIISISPIFLTHKVTELLSCKPVKIYDNLNSLDTLKKIREDNKNKAGIYSIINKVNGKIYIGSAITGRIYERFRRYIKHGLGNKIIAKSVNKYGLDKFAFIILEYYPYEIKNKITPENFKHVKLLLKLETKYISLLEPEYKKFCRFFFWI